LQQPIFAGLFIWPFLYLQEKIKTIIWAEIERKKARHDE